MVVFVLRPLRAAVNQAGWAILQVSPIPSPPPPACVHGTNDDLSSSDASRDLLCSWNIATCPRCDTAMTTDSNCNSYRILCDSDFGTWNGGFNATTKTLNQCTRICDAHPRCSTASRGPNHGCRVIYTGSEWAPASRKGWIALIPEFQRQSLAACSVSSSVASDVLNPTTLPTDQPSDSETSAAQTQRAQDAI